MMKSASVYKGAPWVKEWMWKPMSQYFPTLVVPHDGALMGAVGVMPSSPRSPGTNAIAWSSKPLRSPRGSGPELFVSWAVLKRDPDDTRTKCSKIGAMKAAQAFVAAAEVVVAPPAS